MQRADSNIVAVPFDVTDTDQVNVAVAHIEYRGQLPDLALYNAGASGPRSFVR